jgi:hypothetical protein
MSLFNFKKLSPIVLALVLCTGAQAFVCQYNVTLDGGAKNCPWYNGRCCTVNREYQNSIDCPSLSPEQQNDLTSGINQACQYQAGGGCPVGQQARCTPDGAPTCNQTMICGQGNNFIYERSYTNRFTGTANCECQ